jgi:hypothetical protein
MSAILDRLPPLATSGVGSLPFERAGEAVRHATAAYDLPFCPQLPRLDGDMIAEWLGADPGRCGWARDRDRERPAAWDAFVARLAERPPAHRVAKLQVTGPVTLAIALERDGGSPGGGSRVVGLAHEVAAWLAANVAGQVRRLGDAGVDALVVADEPGLASAGLTAAHAPIWEELRATAPAWGMHVCGPVPWDLVDALELDLLSLDVASHGCRAEARPGLGRLVRRGGRVAWGVVDPVEPRSASDAGGLAAASLESLVAGPLTLERIAGRSLLTPSCGTGRLSAERERLVAATLGAAAQACRAAQVVASESSSRSSSRLLRYCRIE